MSNLALLNDRSVSLDEKMSMCVIMARSSFVPKIFANKPEDVFLAVSFGASLGLAPLQSLQTICIINGKACVYGDGLVAICSSKPDFEYINETFDGSTMTASCAIKLKDRPEHVVTFSLEDAKKAKLTSKAGPWQEYPKRMLQMRARGFAIRDRCAHHLMGLITREEADDYPNGNTFDHSPVNTYDSNAYILLNNEQKMAIVDLLGKAKIEPDRKDKLLEHYKVKSISDLTAKQAEDVINKLNKILDTIEVVCE